MLHGEQRGLFDLDFRTPAGCADQLAAGAADIGIVPSFELTRQDLEVIPGAGIACHGPVRSILLISSQPAAEIRTLAADSSSRTSVELARLILEQRYGAVLPSPKANSRWRRARNQNLTASAHAVNSAKVVVVATTLVVEKAPLFLASQCSRGYRLYRLSVWRFAKS